MKKWNRLNGTPVKPEELYHIFAAQKVFRRLTMAASLNGVCTGPDGRSGSITVPEDAVILEAARAASDFVLIGRVTLETERYVPFRPWNGHTPPALVICSNQGIVPSQLQDQPFGRGPVHLLTSNAASPRRIADAVEWLGHGAVHVYGDSQVDFSAAIPTLQKRFGERMQCEGGPRLAAHLWNQGLLDEVVLTLAPVLMDDGARLLDGLDQPSPLRLGQLFQLDDTLCGLWAR